MNKVLARVLIAEDIALVRRRWERSFERKKPYGICQFVGSGRDAIDAIRQMPYDVAVLDVGMEDIDGVEALRQIKGLQRNIKAFFLTGTFDRKRVAQLAAAAGVPPEQLPDKRGYLVAIKPVTPRQLERIIDCLLDDRYDKLPPVIGIEIVT